MIGTIISYCTNDYRFLCRCIDEARKFSSQIIVPVCDHFFDGSPENKTLLEHTFVENPESLFIEFFYSKELYTPYFSCSPSDPDWTRLWHVTSRYLGFLHLQEEIEYVLFLDSDEIVDGKRFAEWLKTEEYRQWNAMRLDCYYYILRPTTRAKKVQELTLFVKKSALSHFFQNEDRYGLFRSVETPKVQGVRGVDRRPLIHHYSWVRPEKEALHKAATWSHKNDSDWESAIRQSFAGNQIQKFFGEDFEFEEIPSPFFDPFSVRIPTKTLLSTPFPHVKKVTRRDMLQMEIEFL